MKRRLRTFGLILPLPSLLCLLLGPEEARAEKGVEPGSLYACLCKIDQEAKTISVVPWKEKESQLDPSAPRVFSYVDQTKFTLKVSVAGVDLKAAKKDEQPVEDGELKNLTDLPAHKVKIALADRDGRQVATIIELIPMFGGGSAPLLMGLGGLSIEFTTRCDCTSPQ